MPPSRTHLTRSHVYTVFPYLLIPDPTLNRRNQRTAIQVLKSTPQLFKTIIIPVSPPNLRKSPRHTPGRHFFNGNNVILDDQTNRRTTLRQAAEARASRERFVSGRSGGRRN
ncbi:hypothetical protein PLEOSDRAFT_153961 [Pleurotus ostreatus PC15]|uniref:Uncharacterized protein n=1 Tax=Pleurotus ostreatus (strain PC15) TaxID=1137138 RepID=A0A067NXL3_PLEO1|nr:hypothetical protein PLEOSDRAFT_153961 [Pleurotus ostreatus PC15]